jgi:glyoxylase-like metal-dependent hydrolase (beta-lactamase superfamily II)
VSLVFDRTLDVIYRTVDDVVPGIRRVVAENPGPYTFKGTATFMIGRGEVAVVDPGPDDEQHIDALLDVLRFNGETVSHILITHTHPDHSPGARLLQERTGAKTFGFGPHPTDELPPHEQYVETVESPRPTNEDAQAIDEDAQAIDDDAKNAEAHGDRLFVPDVPTTHMDRIDGLGWTIEAIHTPGHLANHLCFALLHDRDVRQQLLFTGDHVMGWSTSVISPPGGDLDDYLASLELLLERPDALYVPTHGSPISDPHRFVRGLLAHRYDRTAQILTRLGAGTQTIPELVAALYVGLDTRLVKAAGRSVFAHLVSLQRRGDVVRISEDSSNPIQAEVRFRLAR